MRPLIPYLLFNGNCRDAMYFYKSCFGGELELMTYADAPKSEQNDCPSGTQDEIMHSSLKKDSFMLMASDWPKGGAKEGNNVHLNIDCESLTQIEVLFEALSYEGKIVQPLSDTFWGARFGMLVDKFGINWMLNCELKK